MDDEKLVAVESVICSFAGSQFAANGISPMEGYLVMKSILSEFQGKCLKAFLLDRVEMVPPGDGSYRADDVANGNVGKESQKEKEAEDGKEGTDGDYEDL